MRVISEATDKKQYVLIVDDKSTQLSRLLQAELKKFSSEVYVSTQVPLAFEKFNYVFFINEKSALKKINYNPRQKVIFIFINQKSTAQALLKNVTKQGLEVKIITCLYDDLDSQDLEKILWFAFSKSNERLLNLGGLRKYNKKEVHKDTKSWSEKFTRKRILLTVLGIFILLHLMAFPFLAAASYFYYKAGNAFKDGDTSKTERFLSVADTSLGVSESLYRPMRPTYLFFSLALYLDSAFDINEKTKSVLHNSLTMSENGNQIFQLILQKDKTNEDKRLLEVRLAKMTQDLSTLEDDLLTLTQKIPDKPAKLKNLKTQLIQVATLVDKGRKIFPHLESLLAQNGERKYLLLFANNMELRPGGGFIGSFGILTMRDMTLQEIKIYDVYDADGQLSVHVDPPEPIRRYLQQPHWFLRDSAFSSDFFENYNEAKFFLKQELGIEGFSGGILLTTSSIQNILEAYGNIYLPDFNENVNKDNFYIKAQQYAEQGFFPGSIQKKNFLGDLAKQILVSADTVSAAALLKQVEKSLDEKQMVMIVEDQNVQKIIDSLYWAGKTITPRCADEDPNCVIDYLFPVDANLGVNKANFFIRRDITQKVKIDPDGTINNSFIMRIQNDSANDVFPGGTYKNYFQLFLPLGSRISTITKDGANVQELDQRQTEFNIVGFYFELPPKQSAEIQVDYQLEQKLPQGASTYQLIWQKQTGSQNSDLNLEISLPSNVSLQRQNFSPLVKDKRIFYNTSLDADKIFLIQLLHE